MTSSLEPKVVRRILIVDDNPEDRVVVRRHLSRDRRYDYVFTEAPNRVDALTALRYERPHVIVLDQRLGVSNGLDLLTEIRDDGHAEIAIVFLTGSGDLAEDPLELGADDYLEKEELSGAHLRRAVRNAVVKAGARVALERSRSDLRAALEEVTRRMEFEQRLMSVVGHDLRSPLQACALSVEALKSAADLPPACVPVLERLERSARNMRHIIDQILDATRLRGEGRFALQKESVDLASIVVDKVDELRTGHPERRIEVHLEPGMTGSFDASALGQAFTNLVANALHHGAQDAPVVVRGRREGATVVVQVENAGRPIPSPAVHTLFAPFQRGPHPSGGLGLGLYVTKAIVDAHGGTIGVRSDEVATVFEVRLPARVVEVEPATTS